MRFLKYAFLPAVLMALTWMGSMSVSMAQESGVQKPSWFGSMWEPAWARKWEFDAMGPGQRQRMMRHWKFLNQQIPEAYLSASNDVGFTTSAVSEGGVIYAENCARCHGATGLGDGEAGRDLTPSPALLAFMVRQPIAVDQYLLWTISEGGKDIGSEMPAFVEKLTQSEIWQVVAYMRAGFPQVETATFGEAPAPEPREGGKVTE